MLKLTEDEKASIRDVDVLRHHDFSIYPDRWCKYLSAELEQRPISCQILQSGKTSRRTIVEGFRKSDLCDEDNARDLFLSVMMWGYGEDNRGPWKTAQMLTSADKIGFQFKDVCHRLKSNDVGSAYKAFVTGKASSPHTLDECGPAFFTKYLYFVSKILGSKPMCVIFDKVIATAFLKRMVPYAQLPIDAIPIADVDRYMGLLRVLDEICVAVGHGCEPDQVELFFFRDDWEKSKAAG